MRHENYAYFFSNKVVNKYFLNYLSYYVRFVNVLMNESQSVSQSVILHFFQLCNRFPVARAQVFC